MATKQTKTLAEKVIAATGSPKTKAALAEKLNVSYTYISSVVNGLVKAGSLVKIEGKAKGGMGRPAASYKRA